MTDRRVWVSFGLVLVLAVVLAGYYYLHKPITPRFALALVSSLVNLGVASLVTAVGGGLGRRLVGRWPVASPGERIAIQAGLGWGLIGLAMVGLGMAGGYYPAVLWPAMLVGLAALWRDVRGWLADVRAAWAALWLPDRMARLAGGFVVFTFVLGVLRALSPPLMWDALAYHLTLPRLYAALHGLRLDMDILYSGMPQITELLYTVAVLLRGDVAAQTLGYLFGVVLALGLAGHAGELLGARLAPVALAILFSAQAISSSLAWAYSDMLLMLMALALLIALRQWRKSGERRWLWLAGVFLGLAGGCKYTGLHVAAAGVGAVAFVSWGRPGETWRARLTRFVAALLPLGGVALLTFAPWLIKNWAITGSPVYPLFIPVGAMDAQRQWFYTRPDLAEHYPLWAALILLRVTFLGRQGDDVYDATLGPLFVIFGLVLALGWRRLPERLRAELRPVAGFTLGGYLGWVTILFVSQFGRQPRLFLPVLMGLAVLGAAGVAVLETLDTRTLRVSLIYKAVLALVLVLCTFESWSVFVGHNPLAFLTGAQSQDDYLVSQQGGYVVAIRWVDGLPAGSRVKFLWEARSSICADPLRCDPDTVIDRWWHSRRTIGRADEILARWKSEGTTHVLIYEAGLDFVRRELSDGYVAEDWSELDALRGQMQLVESISGTYSLYALRVA